MSYYSYTFSHQTSGLQTRCRLGCFSRCYLLAGPTWCPGGFFWRRTGIRLGPWISRSSSTSLACTGKPAPHLGCLPEVVQDEGQGGFDMRDSHRNQPSPVHNRPFVQSLCYGYVVVKSADEEGGASEGVG